MHPIHSLFSVPVNLYSTSRHIFTCQEELTDEGLPLVVELPAEALAVRRSVLAVTREDHISHLEGFSPPDWKVMTCERVGELSTGSHDLLCRVLTFAPPYCAAWILGRT